MKCRRMLRKEFLKVPKYKRAKKAVTGLKSFLVRHMKSQDVYIGKYLNDYMWSRGIKNPPHKVQVQVRKGEDGRVIAELVGKPMPALKGKKDEKSKIEKIAEKFKGKKKEVKEAEVVKEEKKAEKKEASPAEPKKEMPKAAPKTESKPTKTA